MKYDDIIDMEKVDEKIAHLVKLSDAANKAEDDCVRSALYDGYDAILAELVELIGTQWCESEIKEAK